MDLKYVQSELHKLSEIIEGWNTPREISSLERDVALDKLRILYDAVRFGDEAGDEAASYEPAPAEVPVSIDLGEVLSLEPLPLAESGFSAETVPGAEFAPHSGDMPEAVYGTAFQKSGMTVTANASGDAPEAVAGNIPESIPAPAVIAAEIAGEHSVQPEAVSGDGNVRAGDEPAAGIEGSVDEENIPAGKGVPAEGEIAVGASAPESSVPGQSEQVESNPSEPSGPSSSGPAPFASSGPLDAAPAQPIAPTLFEIEDETSRHRRKQRVIMSLYNPETPAQQPASGKTAPSPAGDHAAKPLAAALRTEMPGAQDPLPVTVPDTPVAGPAPAFSGGAPAPVSAVPSVEPAPHNAGTAEAGEGTDEAAFEEITLSRPGAANGGTVLGEVINHDKQTLADTIAPPRDMASELRRSEHVTDLRRAIGINDKFLMIRDLFGGDAKAYEAAVDKLNAFDDFDDCMIYIAENYAWNANSDGAKFLMELLERKFA